VPAAALEHVVKAAREFQISLNEGNPADSILVEAAVRFIKRSQGDEAA
jgi:hypothetical protein